MVRLFHHHYQHHLSSSYIIDITVITIAKGFLLHHLQHHDLNQNQQQSQCAITNLTDHVNSKAQCCKQSVVVPVSSKNQFGQMFLDFKTRYISMMLLN